MKEKKHSFMEKRVVIVTKVHIDWLERLKMLLTGQCKSTVVIDCENFPGNVQTQSEIKMLPVKEMEGELLATGYAKEEKVFLGNSMKPSSKVRHERI